MSLSNLSNAPRLNTPLRQRGATLIIGLIMLMMTTVALISATNMTKNSLAIIDNMQNESAVLDIANSTVEAAISTTRVVNAPSAVFLVGCGGVLNSLCYDRNGDGVNDVTARLTPDPFCLQSQIIQNNQLDLADPNDAGCIISSRTEFGVIGTTNQNSLCATSLWEVTAVASDPLTSTTQSVTGDYSVRVPTDAVETSCPS